MDKSSISYKSPIYLEDLNYSTSLKKNVESVNKSMDLARKESKKDEEYIKAPRNYLMKISNREELDMHYGENLRNILSGDVLQIERE